MPCYKDEKQELGIASFDILIYRSSEAETQNAVSKTRREAQEWEREFHLQKAKKL